jgi:hypothetical protein
MSHGDDMRGACEPSIACNADIGGYCKRTLIGKSSTVFGIAIMGF